MASPGKILRTLLGNRLSRFAGHYYRAFFVDLDKVASALSANIPNGALVADLGGGDGYPLNYLLAGRPDLRVILIEPGRSAGQWIAEPYAQQVTILAGSNLDAYLDSGGDAPDALIVSDVMHHIPVQDRPRFLAGISRAIGLNPGLRLLIKDIEPIGIRARLSELADRYITGDRGINPIGKADLERLICNSLGSATRNDTNLYALDAPNYAVVFTFPR